MLAKSIFERDFQQKNKLGPKYGKAHSRIAEYPSWWDELDADSDTDYDVPK